MRNRNRDMRGRAIDQLGSDIQPGREGEPATASAKSVPKVSDELFNEMDHGCKCAFSLELCGLNYNRLPARWSFLEVQLTPMAACCQFDCAANGCTAASPFPHLA